MATLYVDYKNGVDTNDGSTGSPLKTLAHCLSAHAGAGDTIKLRGSIADKATWFREYNHTISLNNLTIVNDTGHLPVLVASHDYTSWSKTGGRTNVYEAACTAGDFWKAWNDATYLTSVASVASCDGLTNSYYFDDAGDKLYVNIGGAAPTSIEAYDVANTWISTVTGTGVTLYGLIWYYQMMPIRAQANVTIQHCKFIYSVGYGAGPSFSWILVTAAGVTIDDCSFHGVHVNTDDIVLSTGASNCTISNCLIYDGFYGIDVLAGTGHVIHDCTLQDASEWNILCENDSAGTIYNVTVINGDYGGIKTGPTGDSSCAWTIHHTTVYRSAGTLRYGFNADDGNANWYHCIAYNVVNGGGFVSQTAGVINAENNIALNCGAYGYQATVACTGTRDYNCAFGNTDNYDAVHWTQGAHDVVADPSFVSTPTDLQLNVGSPCIDTGVAIAGINDGYVGVAPDIGRYEVPAAAPSSKQSSMIQRLLVIR